MTPEFPLRILFEDGECLVIASPDDLIQQIDSIDSTDPLGKVWIRDAFDRTVLLRMRGGFIEELRLLP